MRTDLDKSSLPSFILCILHKERVAVVITLTGFKIFRMAAVCNRLHKVTKSDYQLLLSIYLLCLSVCTPSPPHGTTVLPLHGFSSNLIFEYFSKTCHENSSSINHLTPNGHYMGRTTQLTSRCCILYI